MHFSDDRTRYKLLKKISYSSEDNKSTIPERHVLYLAEPKQCRNCGGTCFLCKDHRPRKPFMDYIDGTLVNIVVYTLRWRQGHAHGGTAHLQLLLRRACRSIEGRL